MTGNVANQESGVQAGLLAIQRMHNKLTRVGVSLNVNNPVSMCVPLPWPILNKRGYKTQMVYPIPDTFFSHPYGRTEALWSMV